MYHLDGNDEWSNIHPSDLWIYNKLFLSRILGYICGPVGTTVPKSDYYIVRPSFNLLGMGRFARKEWIEKYTDHIHPAEFWCEIFIGEHLSVDFKNQEAELVVLGTKDEEDPYYKWQKWEKIDKKVKFPTILRDLKGKYEYINCEFIDGKLIEVHFRQNPDFRHENKIAIPIWNEKELNKIDNMDEYTFIKDSEFKRLGFWVK
jgi:hypothetical protein